MNPDTGDNPMRRRLSAEHKLSRAMTMVGSAPGGVDSELYGLLCGAWYYLHRERLDTNPS